MAREERTSLGTPAYLPWKTFMNTLDALADHTPNRIDPSAFPGQSGGMKNQLLIAFRFFGFSDDESRPSQALRGCPAGC